MANPAPWEPERVHLSRDRYLWESAPLDGDTGEEEDSASVTDTSMAELAERKLREAGLHGCLLNVGGPLFDGRPSVEIVKQPASRATLQCACSDSELDAWLLRVEVTPPYTADARDPPRDEQTCLVNRGIYELTGRVDGHGRKIYRHLVRKDLYCVDNLHFGDAAHLEVFDKRGRHLGEAHLDGQMIPGTKDPNKSLKA